VAFSVVTRMGLIANLSWVFRVVQQIYQGTTATAGAAYWFFHQASDYAVGRLVNGFPRAVVLRFPPVEQRVHHCN